MHKLSVLIRACTTRLLKYELLVVSFLILILYAASFAPIIHNYKITPPNRYYYGSVEYAIDTDGILAIIQEGYHGHWQRFSNISTQLPFHYDFTKFEYILVGQITRILQADPLQMYHLSRYLISFIYIWSIYLVVRKIFPQKKVRLVSILLIFFSTSITIPWLPWSRSLSYIIPRDALPLSRLTDGQLHFLLGSMCSFLSMYFISRSLEENYQKPKYLFLASLTGFIGSWVYFTSMFLAVLAFDCYMAILFFSIIRKKTPGNIKNLAIRSVIYNGFVFLPALYVFLTNFFQAQLSSMEKMVPFDNNFPHYFLIVGLPYIFGLFAIPKALKTKNSYLGILTLWLFVHPLSVYVLVNFMNINRIRFFYSPFYVVYAILATYGIIWIKEKLERKILKPIAVGITGIIILLILISGAYTYKIAWDDIRLCLCQDYINDYGSPLQETMGGMWWLRDHTTEKDIVLTGNYSGTLVPAFSGNLVYQSLWYFMLQPPNYQEVSLYAMSFYNEMMEEADARAFLLDNHIGYVFFSVQEYYTYHKNGVSYPFLQLVYENGKTKVYRVSL